MRYLLFLISAVLMAQPYNLVPTGAVTFNSNGASGFSAGNYLTMPAGPLNNACTTIEAWVNPANLTTWQWVVNNYDGSTPTHALGFVAGGNIYGQIGSGTVNGHTLTTGTHQHLAVQQCSGTITIFVDGVQRGTTSSTGPFPANTTARIGMNPSSGEIWSGSFRHLTIWASARYTACGNGSTCFTPAASYTGAEGMKAYYPLTVNGNDAAVSSSPLTAGTLSQVNGLKVTAATGGTVGSGYIYQLQSYSGACVSGTFANDGAALTGQTSFALFARDITATTCYRVVVTDAASATANSNSITYSSGGGSGGPRSY